MQSTKTENRVADDVSPAAVHKVTVQPKLTIGAVNDPLEHEADAMADKVMNMSEVSSVASADSGSIQRKCTDCEEEDKVLRKPQASFIQPKQSGSGSIASEAVSKQIHTSKGSGTNIDKSTRSFMENRFSTDFSDVRIHTSREAIQMNRELYSKAFTVGNDIYFNEGQYKPHSNEGRHLLAHELTHTLQQTGMAQTSKEKIERKGETFSQIFTKISNAPIMISKGEKWDAFWDVGPYDAYKAKKIADHALAAAKKTGLPGLHNGPADAWRHCFWNCEMTKDIGRDQAKSIADNHEKHGKGPAVENLMDSRNNWEGRDCGEKKGGCDTCCQSKLEAGILDVIVGGKMVPSGKVARTGGEQETSYYNK